MKSDVLRTAVRIFLPILLMYSIIVLLRGHHEPGGGFIGGLVAAAALSLHAMAYSPAETRRLIRLDLPVLVSIGLGLVLASGLAGVLAGQPFLTAQWLSLALPGVGRMKLGTPLLFDLGVYLLVASVALTMVLSLAEE